MLIGVRINVNKLNRLGLRALLINLYIHIFFREGWVRKDEWVKVDGTEIR